MDAPFMKGGYVVKLSQEETADILFSQCMYVHSNRKVLECDIPEFDEIVSPSDDDFQSSGLVSSSVIRLSFLTVITRNNIIGSIGSISKERHQRLLYNLSQYLIQSRD